MYKFHDKSNFVRKHHSFSRHRIANVKQLTIPFYSIFKVLVFDIWRAISLALPKTLQRKTLKFQKGTHTLQPNNVINISLKLLIPVCLPKSFFVLFLLALFFFFCAATSKETKQMKKTKILSSKNDATKMFPFFYYQAVICLFFSNLVL